MEKNGVQHHIVKKGFLPLFFYLYISYHYKKKDMMQFLRKLVKRWYVRYTIKLRYNKFNEKQPVTDSEKICKSICYRLINEEDSKFLIAPISGKRYINNKRLDLFVILDDRRISITDHIYHYDVIVTERDWDRVTKMYDNRTEKIRQDFEDNVRSQINNSLNKILYKIQRKNVSRF